MPTSRREIFWKKGQAMIELALGLFALTLVVSALCGFACYIAKSLRLQNELRTGAGGSNSRSDRVTVDDFAAQYVFGTTSLKMEHKVKMPDWNILK